MYKNFSNKIRLGKKGTIKIPKDLLEKAGISIEKKVWIISDGEIIIIRNVFIQRSTSSINILSQIKVFFRKIFLK